MSNILSNVDAMDGAAIGGGPDGIIGFAMHLKLAEAGEVTVLEGGRFS